MSLVPAAGLFTIQLARSRADAELRVDVGPWSEQPDGVSCCRYPYRRLIGLVESDHSPGRLCSRDGVVDDASGAVQGHAVGGVTGSAVVVGNAGAGAEGAGVEVLGRGQGVHADAGVELGSGGLGGDEERDGGADEHGGGDQGAAKQTIADHGGLSLCDGGSATQAGIIFSAVVVASAGSSTSGPGRISGIVENVVERSPGWHRRKRGLMSMYSLDVGAVVRVLLPSGWHKVRMRADGDGVTSTFIIGSYDLVVGRPDDESWQQVTVHCEDPGFAFTDDDTGEAVFGPLSSVQAVAADPDKLRAARRAADGRQSTI